MQIWKLNDPLKIRWKIYDAFHWILILISNENIFNEKRLLFWDKRCFEAIWNDFYGFKKIYQLL